MERLDAWLISEELVAEIVRQHGLEEIRKNISIPTSMITSGLSSNPFTKVDQHIDHILHVADWLLEGE